MRSTTNHNMLRKLLNLNAMRSDKEEIHEIDETLRIGVRINSGDPFVPGVLGTEEPTFEITCSEINIAKKTEHFCVPMQSHISHTVYLHYDVVYSLIQ